MNQTFDRDERGGGDRDERQVRHLLEQAGARPEVPAEDLAAIKAAFTAEWRRRQGKARPEADPPPAVRWWPARSASGWAALAAAAVLLVVGLAWWQVDRIDRLRPADPAPVAHVAAVAGEVRIGTGAVARAGVIPAGAWIETSDDSHLALELTSGPALRLAAGSRARLVTPSAVELARGAVYVDSAADAPRTAAIEVRTPLGVATDVGTQFEVRLLAGEPVLRVRVREGLVRLSGDAGSASVAAGGELTLHADGRLTRGEVALHGDPWRWVLAAAPPFTADGKTLGEVLAWVARETGWRVRYTGGADPAVYEPTRLHGSLTGVPPDLVPEVVLPGAGLAHRLEDGVLWISPRSSS